MYMLLNPVIAILHNTQRNTWHPIVFEERPLPGEAPTLVRHRSKGHHTTGFPTEPEAAAAAAKMATQLAGRLSLASSIEWDGVDMPAMTAFFQDHELTHPRADAQAA